jgi:hypothetical protein
LGVFTTEAWTSAGTADATASALALGKASPTSFWQLTTSMASEPTSSSLRIITRGS